jgi:hypothetical protein
MIGSSTQRLAEWYTRRLRAEFEREHVARAELNDQKIGIAVDAVRTMQQDFGAFKPDAKEIWRAEAFTILQPAGLIWLFGTTFGIHARCVTLNRVLTCTAGGTRLLKPVLNQAVC